MNNKKLITDLNNACNIIHQKNIKGVGNYIIVSPEFYEKVSRINLKFQRRKKLNHIFKNEKK